MTQSHDILERHTRRLARRYAHAVEDSVRGQVGIEFRGTVEVRVAKPRWMPAALYRYLMRTIVVITDTPTAKVKR